MMYKCIRVLCNRMNLGDAGVVVHVDDMLGDIGSDGGRRHQEWPQPSERDHNNGRHDNTQSHPSQQNVFGFITDWITSVSFMKGILLAVNKKENRSLGEFI